MIIGNGMLAKEFVYYKGKQDVIIFASGVSNSRENNQAAFDREKKLLLETINNAEAEKIIYFSTCSMYDHYFENNAYTNHKLHMENILLENKKNFIIFRLPQVLGNNNQFQLMGFLYEKIKSKQLFDLYDVERNIIDIVDVRRVVDYILDHNCFNKNIINIANPCNIRVVELVKTIERLHNIRAHYNLIKKTGDFYIDTSDVAEIFSRLGLFSTGYIEDKLRQYYG